MDLTSAIRTRRSVRTFNGELLGAETLNRIEEFAKNASNPYGIPIEWILLNAAETGLSSPVIVGESDYLTGKMARVPHAEEAFGFSFEQIVLFAETLGVGTTWIAGTFDRSAFEKTVGLSPDEVMPCVTPLGYPAKKMSLRETMMRKGVRADWRLPFEELFFNGGFDQPLTPESAGEWKELLSDVRLAPSAVNKQPWRIVLCGDQAHFYEKHRSAASGGGFDIQKVDLGIALCHFALSGAAHGIGIDFSIDDPGLKTPEGVDYIGSYVRSE